MCEKCRAVRIDEYVDNPFIGMLCEDKVVGPKPPLETKKSENGLVVIDEVGEFTKEQYDKVLRLKDGTV